jgi:hypothetical protein
MNNAGKIEAKLVGSEDAKQRRAKLVAELAGVFAKSGPQAVTDEMTRRIDTLADAFAHQLRELTKQL